MSYCLIIRCVHFLCALTTGPAPESLTDKIYKATTTISSYRSVKNLGEVNIDALGTRNYFDGAFRVEVIDSVDDYLEMVMRIFDFVRLRTFVKDNPDFKFLFDAMNGGSSNVPLFGWLTLPSPVRAPF